MAKNNNKSTKKETPQAKYERLHTTRVSLKLSNNTDADILDFLSTCGNKQGLIKKLLRDYISKQSE